MSRGLGQLERWILAYVAEDSTYDHKRGYPYWHCASDLVIRRVHEIRYTDSDQNLCDHYGTRADQESMRRASAKLAAAGLIERRVYPTLAVVHRVVPLKRRYYVDQREEDDANRNVCQVRRLLTADEKEREAAAKKAREEKAFQRMMGLA